MKFIVNTTINPPTKALEKFRHKNGWTLIVVGDKKTPHSEYEKWDGVVYIHPKQQEERYPELSKLLGWNCIQRRNIGYLEAMRMGAEIIATVDDDNIPRPEWGQNLIVGTKAKTIVYQTKYPVFDPLRPFAFGFWHRGYPIQLLGRKRTYTKIHVKEINVMVEASLWNGNPDIDAIARITLDDPQVNFHAIDPYTSNAMMPFNSQNTFLTREALKNFFLFPHIGRMDDIWGAYIFQHKYPNTVVFTKATVNQERNPHDFLKDMEQEQLGYSTTIKLVNDIDNWKKYLPKKSYQAYKEYVKLCTQLN